MKEILDQISGEALQVREEVYVSAIGVSLPAQYLNLSINYDLISVTDIDIDKDVLRLGLKGNGFGYLGVESDFDDFKMESANIGRLALTGAKRFEDLGVILHNDWLDELTVGFTFTYFMGFAYMTLEEASGSIYANYGEFEGNGLFETYTSYSGNGVGLDLGIAAKVLNRRGIVGLSVINLINKINWNDGTRGVYSFDTEFHPYWTEDEILPAPQLAGMEDFDAYFERNFNPVGSTIEDQTLTSSLPSSLILSGGYWLKKDLLLTGAIREGLNATVGNSFIPSISAGCQYLVHPRVPLRGGLGYNSRGGFTLGFGSGIRLGIFRADIGIGYENGILNYARGFIFAFNTAILLDKPPEDPFHTNRYWQNEADKMRDIINSGNVGKEDIWIPPKNMLEDVDGTGVEDKIIPGNVQEPVIKHEESGAAQEEPEEGKAEEEIKPSEEKKEETQKEEVKKEDDDKDKKKKVKKKKDPT